MGYTVYIKVDEQNRITAVNSSAFLYDATGWVEIDSGFGDRFYHAQGNYFSLPIMDERGIWRYKLEEGNPVERTSDEMDADVVEPENKPTTEQRLTAVEEQIDMLLSGVTSDE